MEVLRSQCRCVVAVGSMLAYLVFLIAIKPTMLQQPLSIVNFRVPMMNDNDDPLVLEEENYYPTIDLTSVSPTEQMESLTNSSLDCDFSDIRFDICNITGEIAVDGKSSTITWLSNTTQANAPTKIRPYTRKWESTTMSMVQELSINRLPKIDPNRPKCDVNHNIPALVFSTGGFQGNFFHELTDVLIPLFITSHNFGGQVQLLVVDFKDWWVNKYKPILTNLSRFHVINLDVDTKIHCFRHVVVGLRSHRELGIDPQKFPTNLSMLDFTNFLRDCYLLRRGSNIAGFAARKGPKLAVISRTRSRAMMNEEEVVQAAISLGFEVVVVGLETTKNMSMVAGIVNSCDAIVGVHGAGLSNMVFLPKNATVIQIIPWGGLGWACRYAFGEPAIGMGLNYVDYEIEMEESSLVEKYPRDHLVFKDPMFFHRQGFVAMWSVFIDKQNVTIDVGRFSGILLDVLKTYNN